MRLANTKQGMKLNGDISKARHTQYTYALAHMTKIVGSEIVEPLGEFHIAAKAFGLILSKYRDLCNKEMTATKVGSHWFNARMKASRILASYLHTNGFLSALPNNIAALTEKYRTTPNPKPIPLDILRLIWSKADSEFKGYMLCALNFGFRQTEIGSLERSHFKTINGKFCVEKNRGKTGVPLAIPVWDSTKKFLDTYGAKTGQLFHFENDTGKGAIDKLGQRMVKVRYQASKINPKALSVCFENFRDTGATFIESVNSLLTPLYLGHADNREAKSYVGLLDDDNGGTRMPMDLASVIGQFENWLKLGEYDPKG